MSLPDVSRMLSAAVAQPPASLGNSPQGHEISALESRAILAKMTDDARAFLTASAIEHLGALTALESHLITIAPLGEARYKELVDSYTIATGVSIRGFR